MRPDERIADSDNDFYVDDLPIEVIATMEQRDRAFTANAFAPDGKAFFVSDLQRWLAGSVVRIAFMGGDIALHRDIEEATRQITDACNLSFDFGYDPATGRYRSWTTNDTAYQAEIRVSFDQRGYKSLVGRDAVTPVIGASGGAMGGQPNQRSLNLFNFPIQRPANWMGVVRHEFLHAVAFLHEHQSPAGGCEAQFRWDDDDGYQPTTDSSGRYIPDTEGRRPGIYTYFAGAPNYWDRATVDHNLRPRTGISAITGAFDQSSVMLYRFPRLFYRTYPNPCAPIGAGIDLSPGDVEGLRETYPFDETRVAELNARRTGAAETLSTAVKKETGESLISPRNATADGIGTAVARERRQPVLRD